MNMKLNKIVSIVFATIFSILFLVLSSTNINMIPKSIYRVYLDGETIGFIKSKTELEDYIDKQQEDLRKKYDVQKVHAPDELVIKKEITFNSNITTVQDIYNQIKDSSIFTVGGYEIVIRGLPTKDAEGNEVEGKDNYIYVLDREIFTESMDNTVESFLSRDYVDAFLNDTQKPIENTGSIIENVFIRNDITIRRRNIPSDKTIYTTKEELSKFLLFGTTEEQKTYVVQSGDTIPDVAFNNKMSNVEFLIANPEFSNENALLYEGQEVTLGILRPQFDLVEEEHVVTTQEQKYETETRYDDNKQIGFTEVIQEGSPGENRITQKVQKVNGQVANVVIAGTEVLKEPTTEIIVRGGKKENVYQGGGTPAATRGQWGWPTVTPYVISSPFGYRWGVLHTGVDISGSGHGSPIFASQAGVVIESSTKWPNGNYVTIDHRNGFFTVYAHLNTRNVSVGQTVTRGQVIGTMGRTGMATGTHLHFEIWQGQPYRGGRPSNPLSFF